MKEILIKYGIPEYTVNAIMMLYNNTRSLVRSPYGDTHFVEITNGVLQRVYTRTIYFYKKHLWTMTENSDLLKLK